MITLKVVAVKERPAWRYCCSPLSHVDAIIVTSGLLSVGEHYQLH